MGGHRDASDGERQDRYDRVENILEMPMTLLAVALIPVFLVPLVTELTPAAERALEACAAFIWAAFVAEYVVLLALAPDRRNFVRTHLFDLALIVLPFLRPLRVARAARVLRGGAALGRATTGVRRMRGRTELRSYGAFVVVTIAFSSLLVWSFESAEPDSNIVDYPDALWWAIVTCTTVGYGDHFPITTGGRVVAFILMLVGIGGLSMITAGIAAYFVEKDDVVADENIEAIKAQLDELQRRLETGGALGD